MVLDKIIEAEDCLVFDLFLRTGRRGQEWNRKDGKGECKNKPRSSQRIDTIKSRPIHEDCIEAFNLPIHEKYNWIWPKKYYIKKKS